MSHCFFAPSTMGDATDDGNLTSSCHRRARRLPKPQVSSYHTHNVDKIGDVADGNGVVAAVGNEDATLLPSQPRRIPRGRPHGRGRMQSPAPGHKYLAVRSSIFLLIPLKKNHQRRRTEGGCDSATLVVAVLISPQRQIQPQPSKKKKSTGLRSSQFCRDFSSSVETPLPIVVHDRRRTEENPRRFPCTALSRL